MENYSNEVFGFGNSANEELEQVSNFNYNSISGLGESDYENEDLFNTEVETNTASENNNIFDNYYNYDKKPINTVENVNDFGVNYVENNDLTSSFTDIFQPVDNNQNGSQQQLEIPINQINLQEPIEVNEINNNVYQLPVDQSVQEQPTVDIFQPLASSENSVNVEPQIDEPKMNFDPMTGQPIVETFEPIVPSMAPDIPEYITSQIEKEPIYAEVDEQPVFEEISSIEPIVPIVEDVQEQPIEQPVIEKTIESEPVVPIFEEVQEQPVVEELVEDNEPITISDTPIEEINKLTEYEEEKIEETDINSLFDKVSVNVKDASEIFRKNTDLKQKIDTRFEALKKLQSELENSRKKQLDEINRYKEEVVAKLTEKKEEIERRLNILKESQATLEKEKQEFEEYKKKEQENIDRVQKEVQSAYDDRREELNHVEDVLRKQKDALDEERSQLSLDRIQYESDKNELANNLLKFNELVNSFTNGVDGIKG